MVKRASPREIPIGKGMGREWGLGLESPIPFENESAPPFLEFPILAGLQVKPDSIALRAHADWGFGTGMACFAGRWVRRITSRRDIQRVIWGQVVFPG